MPFTLCFGAFEHTGMTDDEGYFKVAIPQNNLLPGWHTASVNSKLGGNTQQYLVVNNQITTGVITDLDDTILISEVTKKLRLLTNTFFKNPMQRKAVLGAAQVYQQLSAQSLTPIFYLSATPRQLYHFVDGFLRHYDFPTGMIITRRLTRDAQGDSFNVRVYKTKKIEAIFAAFPHMKFKLIGDDGEHDPDIYHDLQTRFPLQVEGVWIRRIVHSTLKYPQQQDFENLIKPFTENQID